MATYGGCWVAYPVKILFWYMEWPRGLTLNPNCSQQPHRATTQLALASPRDGWISVPRGDSVRLLTRGPCKFTCRAARWVCSSDTSARAQLTHCSVIRSGSLHCMLRRREHGRQCSPNWQWRLRWLQHCGASMIGHFSNWRGKTTKNVFRSGF